MDQPKFSRVFVVDDEVIIASTLALILRHEGFDATSFCNPLEALQAAHSQAPDLLLSDVVMPQLSGIDLAIQMQEQSPDCKVLLFSGQADTDGLLQTTRARGYRFEILPKPLHPLELLRKMREALEDTLRSRRLSADRT